MPTGRHIFLFSGVALTVCSVLGLQAGLDHTHECVIILNLFNQLGEHIAPLLFAWRKGGNLAGYGLLQPGKLVICRARLGVVLIADTGNDVEIISCVEHQLHDGTGIQRSCHSVHTDAGITACFHRHFQLLHRVTADVVLFI